MNFRLFLVFCLSVTFLLSCSDVQMYEVRNDGEAASDSTLLCRSDSVIKVFIGDRIVPIPLSSQVMENESGKQIYILLDENTLYCFDMENGRLIRSEELKDCGNLNNYSGFLCLPDASFVYNYKQKSLYMLDSLYQVKRKWKVVFDKKDVIDPEALTDSPILYTQGKLILSGVKMLDLEGKTDLPVSCSIDVLTGNRNIGGNYPEVYFKGNFGGIYFNAIYHTLAADGRILYSFPADHYVYFYSPDFAFVKKCFMGSRYSPVITSSDFDLIDLVKDKELRIKYYISQYSYSNVLYDKYRKVYYRIAQHPLASWKSGETFVKPFSIIVMDESGKLLSETPIQQDYKSLNLHNVHVVKDGLLIQKKTSDENVIEFVKFVLNGYEN